MATKKISELTAISTVSDTDVLPIVDSSELETKKITGSQLKTYVQGDLNTRLTTAEGEIEAMCGTINMWATSTPPLGYLLCDGSAVSRVTYSSLFAVLGTTYGTGNGSTTFNLPNLKGKVPVGRDSEQTEFNVLGKTGGEKTHQLTVDEMPSHKHNIIDNFVDGNPESDGKRALYSLFREKSGYNDDACVVSTGGNQAHNNLQPYIVLNYIIKY